MVCCFINCMLATLAGEYTEGKLQPTSYSTAGFGEAAI